MKKSVLTLILVILMTSAFGPSIIRADEIILDDLLVYGSTCLGFDCTNNMEFNYSTLQLQDINLRIFFNDTSNSSSFPKNDWEIIANDTADGGESYLGFADRGEGKSSSSGSGKCVGGTNDGSVCSGIGDCAGTCSKGELNGQSCNYGDSSPCRDGGGICGISGICSGGTLDGQSCTYYSCAEQGGTCIDAGECVEPGAIIFKMEAGAPENSLLIDSTGIVKIKELEVAGDINEGATTKVGIIAQNLFSGSPKMATVTFDTPFEGDYAVTLTTVISNPKKPLRTMVVEKSENGFTAAIYGRLKNLIEVDWIAREVQ